MRIVVAGGTGLVGAKVWTVGGTDLVSGVGVKSDRYTADRVAGR